jgi:hypothetical protein
MMEWRKGGLKVELGFEGDLLAAVHNKSGFPSQRILIFSSIPTLSHDCIYNHSRNKTQFDLSQVDTSVDFCTLLKRRQIEIKVHQN